MNNIECPRCSENSITLKDKLRAGKWLDVYCPACGGRMCAQPIVMAIMYMLLTWNFLFFGYLAFRESSLVYGGLMIGGWLILEMFIYTIPLVNLRARNTNPS